MSPIILTRNDGTLRDDAVKAIKADRYAKKILIVGGTLAVSESVKSQLGNGYTYVRLGGKNRYDTSNKIAAWTVKQSGFHANYAMVATGKNFPDALVAGAAGGLAHVPLYLSDGTSVPAPLKDGSVSLDGCAIIGGSLAVSTNVELAIKDRSGLVYHGTVAP